MTQANKKWMAGVIAGACLGGVALGGSALAQQGPEDTDLLPVQPYPAQIMPLAAQTLALDITWTGMRYVAVGDWGHILLSNDGRDWLQVQAPHRAALTAVHFPTPDKGWAVGHDAVILHTGDGGRSWDMQHFEPEREEPFHDVYFANDRRGVAVGAYGLAMITEDGGETWDELYVPELSDDGFHINNIVQLADGRYFVVGEFGLLAVGDDLDGPWRRLKPPYDSSLFGALPLDDGGVLIYGLRGNVFIAEDLTAVPDLPDDIDMELMMGDELTGEGWRRVDTQSVNSMFGGVRLDDGNFLLVGLNGQLLQLGPNGQLIGAEQTRSRMPLAAVQPGPNGALLLVGEAGVERFQR